MQNILTVTNDKFYGNNDSQQPSCGNKDVSKVFMAYMKVLRKSTVFYTRF